MATKNDTSALTQFVQTHLPIAQQMGIEVEQYDGQELILTAPLDPNINDKGTAFGGSIYCVAVFSCWGMVYLKAQEHGLTDPNIVVATGDIKYLKPVAGALRARCRLTAETTFDDFWQYYDENGKAKVELSSQVINDAGDVLAEFNGKYAII